MCVWKGSGRISRLPTKPPAPLPMIQLQDPMLPHRSLQSRQLPHLRKLNLQGVHPRIRRQPLLRHRLARLRSDKRTTPKCQENREHHQAEHVVQTLSDGWGAVSCRFGLRTKQPIPTRQQKHRHQGVDQNPYRTNHAKTGKTVRGRRRQRSKPDRRGKPTKHHRLAHSPPHGRNLPPLRRSAKSM